MDRRRGDAGTVEVIYALPREQTLVTVTYEPGLSAGAAVERSGLLQRYPELATSERVLGVFGLPVSEDHALSPGDRVEICRPLIADPRDMRRAFVTGGRVMGGAESQRPARGRKTRASG